MIPKAKIKIYLVSSSRQIKNILEEMAGQDTAISLEGVSFDFNTAVAGAKRKEVKVIVVDTGVEGFNAEAILKRISQEYPVPVLFLVSAGMSVNLQNKWVPYDCVTKPEVVESRSGTAGFTRELSVRVKIISTAVAEKRNVITQEKKTEKIIAIGASTGGVEAIQYILTELPDNLPGIVIVQHIPPNFSRLLSERLNALCRLRVKEAQDGDEVSSGLAIIAAGDKHMKIVKSGEKYIVKCFEGPRVSGHCPSVDVMFESVANCAGANAIGVILTGMGADGAKGLLAMRHKGAFTIGQDEGSCVIYGMPMEAHKLGAVTKQVPLKAIARELIERSK